MSAVGDLLPGDLVTLSVTDLSAVFIARTEHPLWPHLQLVIWKMSDGSWSHDALFAQQEIGTIAPSTSDERKARLRRALWGGRAA